MRAPSIAIPGYHLAPGRVQRWETGAFALPEAYVAAVRRSGASPVIVPGPPAALAEEVLAPFSGLLLAGGGDVDPSLYGAARHPSVYGIDHDRDALEAALLPAAVAAGMPVLAICRGLQLLNVVFGGTLVQHLPEVLDGVVHGDPTKGLSVHHAVQVQPGSLLAGAVAAERVERCASHHHQGLATLGEGLVPVAWSDDGLVEAVERPAGPGWIVGVQWHPEVTASDDPQQQAVFDAFVDEARRWR